MRCPPVNPGHVVDPAAELDPGFGACCTVDGDDAVVAIWGEVDLAARDELWSVIEAALDRGERLAIDLTETTFFDSIGLGVILRASQERGPGADPIVLRSPSDAVCKLLRITGVDKIVSVQRPPTAA